MDDVIQTYKENLKEIHRIKDEIKTMLFLEDDLECLDSFLSVCCVITSLNEGRKVEDLEERPHAMEIEMIITIGRSLASEERKDLISKLEKIKATTVEVDKTRNIFRTRFRYLHSLLGDELLFKLLLEIGSLFLLTKAIPSEVMKYGINTYGSPLLSQHPLVTKASPKNQEKLLRKLCCKVTIAAKLDFCESNFEIDFSEQMERIFNNLENNTKQDGSILKVPLARKETRRGGIKARRKRSGSLPQKKRRFLKLDPSGDDES
ncbi:hypothetical protein KMI_02g02710 [Encephalitozoon hellem]|nr:hypothetical protein KMI_02g02710 [Encephalitozoon hellem]